MVNNRMPNYMRIRTFFLAASVVAAGQSISAFALTQPENFDDCVVAEKQFHLAKDGEVLLKVTAKANGTSWDKKEAEAAVVTCQVDGHYSQDIILFMGAERFTYRALLGDLPAAAHRLTFRLNKEQSTANATSVTIDRVQVEPVDKLTSLPAHSHDTDAMAFSHAPILFARPDSIGKYTDIPIIMWYEVFKDPDGTVTIRYSYVFTNEDAGTATEALMARWGRTTDIEWAYEMKLKGKEVIQEAFQAVNHQSTPFNGKHVGTHPVLIVASDNNNFADAGESAMRFRLWPELMDLSNHSREELMDRHPWAYKLMAQELYREGKVSEAGGHQVRDPRDYVYIEAKAPRPNMGIDLKVGMKDGTWFNSAMANKFLRITREGWFRVAVRLPPNETPADARRVTFDCHPFSQKKEDKQVDCSGVIVQKVFGLSKDYVPRPLDVETGP